MAVISCKGDNRILVESLHENLCSSKSIRVREGRRTAALDLGLGRQAARRSG
jgi:hypothetical protein